LDLVDGVYGIGMSTRRESGELDGISSQAIATSALPFADSLCLGLFARKSPGIAVPLARLDIP